MRIWRPIKTNRLGQVFGADKACVYPDNKVVTKYGDTCPSGSVSLYQSLGMKGHSGEDWNAWSGESLFFPGNWTGWMKSEIDKHGGIGVDVISDKPLLNGNHVKLRFWHLMSVNGYDGKPVAMGDLIGWCDNTGLSSGSHLHWSLKECDSKGNSINKDNGYYGAIDFRPYFDNTFVLDVIGLHNRAYAAIELAKKVIAQVREFIRLRDNK